MSTHKQVPEIRFKGFDGIWEEQELDNLASFSKGNGYTKGDLTNTGTQILLYGRLYTKYETVIEDLDTFVELKPNSVISQGGEVVVPASGETAIDISRASVIEKPGVILGGDLNVIKPSATLDSTFLALTISNGTQQKEMTKRAQGSSVVHLHNSDLKRVELLYPSKPEQEQIGTFFKQIDKNITLQQRKLDLLKTQKQGYLQKMFPKNGQKVPELRFKGFADDWEERKLEKVFDTITDYVANGSFESLRKNVNSSDINGFAYLVRLQDASNNWQGPWLYTDQHGYEFLKKSRLQPDDIIMANVGSVGKFFLVPKLDKPMTLAPNAVLIKSSENDQGFLYQMMLTPEMQYKIFEKTTPGVQSKINKTDFKMIETRLPNMDEQKKIGAFFKQLDDTIALHQRKLDLLKEQKKGFLQKMFVS